MVFAALISEEKPLRRECYSYKAAINSQLPGYDDSSTATQTARRGHRLHLRFASRSGVYRGCTEGGNRAEPPACAVVSMGHILLRDGSLRGQ